MESICENNFFLSSAKEILPLSPYCLQNNAKIMRIIFCFTTSSCLKLVLRILKHAEL